MLGRIEWGLFRYEGEKSNLAKGEKNVWKKRVYTFMSKVMQNAFILYKYCNLVFGFTKPEIKRTLKEGSIFLSSRFKGVVGFPDLWMDLGSKLQLAVFGIRRSTDPRCAVHSQMDLHVNKSLEFLACGLLSCTFVIFLYFSAETKQTIWTWFPPLWTCNNLSHNLSLKIILFSSDESKHE